MKTAPTLDKIRSIFGGAARSPEVDDDPLQRLLEDGQLKPERLDALPVDLSFFPDGWMSALELQLLYNLGKSSRGDFLEIGPWIGRSTTAITLGRHDQGADGRRFDTADFGFVSLPDFCAQLGTGIDYASADEIARPVLGNGGSIAYLLENLRKRSLLSQVTSVIRGNALEVPLRESYGVIFCDAVHSVVEIDLTGPLLARLARPGTWMLCDDIHQISELVATLEKYVQFESLTLLESLDPSSKGAFGRVRSTSVHRS